MGDRKPILRVGDEVRWRYRLAKVKRISLNTVPGNLLGDQDVQAVHWEMGAYFVVTLDNHHWAYGDQVSPKEDE
jgi:hypothetical protein